MKKILMISAITLAISGTANAKNHHHNNQDDFTKKVVITKKINNNGKKIITKEFFKEHDKKAKKCKHKKRHAKNEQPTRIIVKQPTIVYNRDINDEIKYLFAKSAFNILEHGFINNINKRTNNHELTYIIKM